MQGIIGSEQQPKRGKHYQRKR